MDIFSIYKGKRVIKMGTVLTVLTVASLLFTNISQVQSIKEHAEITKKPAINQNAEIEQGQITGYEPSINVEVN